MDKAVAGVLGAVGALVAGAPGQAAPGNVLQVASYADLLRPIPDAAATLRALDAAKVEQAQYYYYPPPRPYYHHHHHFYRPRYYHHHHHHQYHHGYGRFYYDR